MAVLFLGFVLIGVSAYAGLFLAYRAYKIQTLRADSSKAVIQTAGSGRCHILLVGDSRIARWQYPAGQHIKVTKLGYSGAGAAYIARAVEPLIARAQPDIVVIQAGGNDAVVASMQSVPDAEATIAKATGGLADISVVARRAGARAIVLLTVVPPIRLEPWKFPLIGLSYQSRYGWLNEKISGIARKLDLQLLDADVLFRDEAGKLRDDYRDDSVHWSPTGYQALNAALGRMIAEKSGLHPGCATLHPRAGASGEN